MARRMAEFSNQTSSSDGDSKLPDERAQPGIVLFGKTIPSRERLNIARTWPVLFLIVAALLFCRQPYAIIHPSLYAEDGCIFFKQQYEMGFAPALVTRYAGYLHFAPRIIAALCSRLPVEYVPAAYVTASLLIAAGTLTFFFAPGFRPIIGSDLLRAGIVIGFTLMPNAEPLMKLAYINWYMLLFTALLTLFSLPKKMAARWLFFIPAAIAAWSNPVTAICVPLMLYRAWKADDWGERLWWGCLILLAISFPFTMEKHPSQTEMILHEQSWKVALLHAIGYRVFCFFFLGSTITYPLPGEGWQVVTGFSLVLAALCGGATVLTMVKVKKAGIARPAPLFLFYLILALPALFVLRKEWQFTFLTWSKASWGDHDRYFFCSTLLLGVLCGVAYERMFRPWMIKRKKRCEVSLLILLGWLTLHGIGFRLDGSHTAIRWSDYAKQIHEAEAKVRQTGRYEAVHLEASPEGFDFDLQINKASANRNN